MQITLDIPEQFAFNQTKPEIGNLLKRYAALALFQSGKLSTEAAAELAGLDIYAFAGLCKKHHIVSIDYPVTDLQTELANFKKIS